MKVTATTSRFAVYLLHYPCTDQGCAHYVGITTPPRIAARMREHAGGRGAKTTSAITRCRTPFALARLWLTDDRKLEADMISRVHQASAWCPICREGRAISVHRPTKRAAGLMLRLDSRYLVALACETSLAGNPTNETSLTQKSAGPPQSRVHP